MSKFLIPTVATSLLSLVSAARAGEMTNLQLYDGGNSPNQLVSFAGYDPSQNYSAQFCQATHDPGDTLYQDFVIADPANVHTNSVPEPTNAVMGGFGLLFVLRFVAKKRARHRLDRCH